MWSLHVVQGLDFRVQGSEFKVQGVGHACGSGFRF